MSDDDYEYDMEQLLPKQISDETAVALCDFLAELNMAVEIRYLHQLRRYHEAHRPPVDPQRPWINLNSG